MNQRTRQLIPTKGFRKKFWDDHASSKAASANLTKAWQSADRILKEDGLPKSDDVDGWAAALKLYEDLLAGLKEAETKARSARMKPEDTLKGIKKYREAIALRKQALFDKGCQERIAIRAEAEKDAKAVRDKIQAWLDEVRRDDSNASSLLAAAERAYEDTSKPLADREKVIRGAVRALEDLLANAQAKAKEAERIRATKVGKGSLWDKARSETVIMRYDEVKRRPLYKRANDGFKSFVAYQNEVALQVRKLADLIPSIETAYEKALNLAVSGADLDRLRTRTLTSMKGLLREVGEVSTEMEKLAAKIEKQGNVNLPKFFGRLETSPPEAIVKATDQAADYAKQDFDTARGFFGRVKHYRQRCEIINPLLAAETELQALIQGVRDEISDVEGSYRRVVDGQKEVLRLVREIRKAAAAKEAEAAAGAPAG